MGMLRGKLVSYDLLTTPANSKNVIEFTQAVDAQNSHSVTTGLWQELTGYSATQLLISNGKRYIKGFPPTAGSMHPSEWYLLSGPKALEVRPDFDIRAQTLLLLADADLLTAFQLTRQEKLEGEKCNVYSLPSNFLRAPSS